MTEPYTIHVDQFDGPMDLLLTLIDKAQVNIQDLFVSQVTQQFIDYVRQMESLDMEITSEFLVMAATLLQIKSRSLLPKEHNAPVEAEDPEEALIRQLNEYRQFKAQLNAFQTQEALFSHAYTKLPEELISEEQRIEWTGLTMEGLMQALQSVLERQAIPRFTPEPQLISRDRFSVRERMKQLMGLIREQKRVQFADLFSPFAGREEIVVNFMAMLELLRQGFVAVRQEEAFAPIWLCLEDRR